MTSPAKQTREALLAAMQQYESEVLNKQFFNEKTGYYDYPCRITKKDVLRRAGIKSRSTLNADYHAGLASQLDNFIKDLKKRTGKYNLEKDDPKEDIVNPIREEERRH